MDYQKEYEEITGSPADEIVHRIHVLTIDYGHWLEAKIEKLQKENESLKLRDRIFERLVDKYPDIAEELLKEDR